MKNILLYTLLLTATLTYAQGLLPEEKVKKESPAQPVQQAKKYDWKDEYYEGLAMVKLDKKYGFIDKTGKEVIPIKYDDAESPSEGLAKVKLNDKYGFIDKTGKEVIPIKYDYVADFSEGLAEVELNNKWFYINQKGECVKDCNNAPADHPIAK
ncbi:WG repeat-containing protein [Capnocytophaga leadbetteri]